MHVLEDAALMARTEAAMLAFGAPFGVIIDEFDRSGMLDTAVEQMGKLFLFTELGDGGTASAATIAIAERGVRNLLQHLGMRAGAPEPAATRLMHSPDPSYFVVAEDRGLFEIMVDPGAEVSPGQPIATYPAERSGLLIGRRWPGSPTRPGDCLAVIATEREPR